LHKKIRSEKCPLSEKIVAMEKKFERLLKLNSLFANLLYCIFAGMQMKINFLLLMKESNLTHSLKMLKKWSFVKAIIKLVNRPSQSTIY